MAYVGSSPAPSSAAFAGVYSQAFSGNGSTTSFTLGRYVAQPANIEVIVNNVQQSPFDGSYTLSGGTTLVFSEAPSSGTNNIYVIYRDYPVQTLTDTGAVRKTGDTMSGRLDFQNSDGNSVVGIQASRFGYSSGYEVLQIGRGLNLETISLGVDVSGNPSGSFTGHGKEIIVPNGASFISPTSDNSTFLSWLRCDSVGRVTMPYQPAWAAKFSTTKSQSLFTPIVFDSVALNIGSHYNGSTGIFTAPVAGRYQVNAHVLRQSGGASYMNLKIAVNGVGQDSVYGNAYTNQFSGEIGFGTSWVVSLAANDTLAIWLGSGSTVTLYATETMWSGHLIG
jgi:hypothetical protein